MFSSDERAIFICCGQHNTVVVKVWRPYLGDDNEDRLTTLSKKIDSGVELAVGNICKFSNDTTMVVIHNVVTKTGILWSIDADHKCLTKEFDFQGITGLYFTPDGKYIVVIKRNRPTLWSIAEGKFTNNPIHFLDNGSNFNKFKDLDRLIVKSFSPNNRQCIVSPVGSSNYYITSYLVK